MSLSLSLSLSLPQFAIVQLVGVQQLSQCPIKALILVWNDRQKQFTGLVPLEQEKFINVLKQVLSNAQRQRTMLLQQQQQQQQQQQAQQAQQGQQTGMVRSSFAGLWSIYGIHVTITSIRSAMKWLCIITDKSDNGYHCFPSLSSSLPLLPFS